MNPTGAGGFSKGQSGNPGGRRKKTAEDIEIQQIARQHGATAIDVLVKIAIWALGEVGEELQTCSVYFTVISGCLGHQKPDLSETNLQAARGSGSWEHQASRAPAYRKRPIPLSRMFCSRT